VFENFGAGEFIALLLLGLFIFGPERLPQVIGDAGRMIRGLRRMARNATTELREELGTDIDLEDLNPRTFVRKHLLSEAEEEELRAPLRGVYREVDDFTRDGLGRDGLGRDGLGRDGLGRDEPGAASRSRPLRDGERAPFDPDAT
jgi:sec-independent protein translocase protein TatB